MKEKHAKQRRGSGPWVLAVQYGDDLPAASVVKFRRDYARALVASLDEGHRSMNEQFPTALVEGGANEENIE